MRRRMLCATEDSLIGLEKDQDPPCTFVSTAGDRTMAVDLLSPVFLIGCIVGLTMGETIMVVLVLPPSLTNDLIWLLPRWALATSPAVLLPLLADDACSIGA